LPILFRGSYETALDICLLAFVPQVGWIHAGIVRFYRGAAELQKRYTPIAGTRIRQELIRFYRRQVAIIAGLAVISSALVITLIDHVQPLRAMLDHRVAVAMLLCTPVLVIGLWNVALLVALSRPGLVLAAISLAVLVNVCVGYLLSRLIAYDLAVIGFGTGGCVLAGLSGWFCYRLAHEFDHAYFAASA
jgi:hypothetical protein